MQNKKYKNQSGKIFGVGGYSHRYSHVQENCKVDTSVSSFSNNLNALQGSSDWFHLTPGVKLTRARTGLERFISKYPSWPLINIERRLLK